MSAVLRLLLPTAAAVAIALLFFTGEQDGEGVIEEETSSTTAGEVGLSGSGTTRPEPAIPAGTPWRELIDGFGDWPKGPKGRALVERATTDAALVQALVDALHSKHDAQRRIDGPSVGDLMSALTWIGAPAAVPLGRALHGGDEEWSHRAAAVLMSLGPDAAGAVPDMARVVKDEDRKVPMRAYMISVCGVTGAAARPIVAFIDELLRSGEADGEFEAVIPEALVAIDGDSPRVRETFGEVIRDGSHRALRAIVAALEHRPGAVSGLVPALRDLLDGPPDRFTASALYGLGYVRDESKAAVDLLERFVLDNESGKYRHAAVHSLAQAGPEGWRRLVAMSDDAETSLADLIFYQLTESEADAAVMMPLMARYLGGDDPNLRAQSFGAAMRMSLPASFVKEHVVPHVEHEDEAWARLAIGVLFTASRPDDELVAILDKRLESLSDMAREEIVQTVDPRGISSDRMWTRYTRMLLGLPGEYVVADSIGDFAQEASGAVLVRHIKLLTELVNDKRLRVAESAVRALADHGEAAAAAVPVLQARAARAKRDAKQEESRLWTTIESVLLDWRRAGVY